MLNILTSQFFCKINDKIGKIVHFILKKSGNKLYKCCINTIEEKFRKIIIVDYLFYMENHFGNLLIFSGEMPVV